MLNNTINNIPMEQDMHVNCSIKLPSSTIYSSMTINNHPEFRKDIEVSSTFVKFLNKFVCILKSWTSDGHFLPLKLLICSYNKSLSTMLYHNFNTEPLHWYKKEKISAIPHHCIFI